VEYLHEKLESEADHSPPSTVKVKNVCRCTSTPQYVFMVRHTVKHRDNFALLLASTLALHRKGTGRRTAKKGTTMPESTHTAHPTPNMEQAISSTTKSGKGEGKVVPVLN
jgi:hypothetical protein